MTRSVYLLPPLATVLTLGLSAPEAAAQTTDVATLLQSVENCLAWRNDGFPSDATPFDGGFEPAGSKDGAEDRHVYREAETGFEITLGRDGEAAFCESTAGAVDLGEDGLDELAVQMQNRVADGRALRLDATRYAFCAVAPGLLSVSRDDDGGAGFRIAFNTDAARDAARGCEA